MADKNETEKKEQWLNYLALTTVLLAVCATLATFKGGGYSTKRIISQVNATNNWSYYQAKSTKGYIHEVQKDELELNLKTITNPELTKAYKEKIDEYSAKITKYDKEKEEIKILAENFEKDRDQAQKHSEAFGIAVIFLQIAILLSSIAALMKKKYIWVIGLFIGVFAVIHFINGFFLFL